MATAIQGAEAQHSIAGKRWREWLSCVALAIVVPALFLGVVEGGLRLFGVGNSAALMRTCSAQGLPAFCNNVFFTKQFFPAGMIRAPYPFAIPTRKSPGTFRIFVLGESAAYGDPDPAYGFSRYLDVMLRRRYPSVKFEVVNASATAINSYVLLPMAGELAEYQPDLFIIYAGNNEVVGPFGPGTVLTRSARALPLVRASILVRRTRIGQLINRVVNSKEAPQEWHGMEMFLDQQVPANSPLLRVTYDNFSANLRNMVSAARKSGARVLISTVATNLKDCAPFASAHRRGLLPDALDSWNQLVQQGAELEAAGSYSDALNLYDKADHIDGEYAELEFRIGKLLLKMGSYPAAREHFVRARDLDTLRFRADSSINNAIRSIAAVEPSAQLIDAEKLFSQQSPHGIPGGDLLYEHVHLKPEGNYLLATAFFQKIVLMLPAVAQRAETNAEVPSQQDCERMLAFTAFDRARLAGEMMQRLMRPPFTNQLNQREQLQSLSFEAQMPLESFEETAAQYEWAIAQRPDDHLLHLNYGMLLYDRDKMAATEQFRSARPYDDIPFEAPDGTLIR
jgi:tetratricopeptide (TPR) repeat protein